MKMNRLKGLVVASLACLLVVGGPLQASAAETSVKNPEDTTSATGRPGQLGLSPSEKHGRAELVVGQSLHGMMLGFEACLLFDCRLPGESSPALFAAGLAGAGIGAGTSLLATRNGIRPGHATALNSGVVWATMYTTLIRIPSSGYAILETRQQIGSLMAGQVAGLGVAAGLYQLLEPAKGDVALVNSFGFWGAAFGLGAFTLLNEYPPAWAPIGTALAASTLAGIGGGVLSHFRPMSRRRVWTINGAGLLGSLVGATVGALFNAGSQRYVLPSTLYGATMMAGTAAGLGIGAWMTDDWTRRQDSATEPTAQLLLAPSPRGSGGMVQISGSF